MKALKTLLVIVFLLGSSPYLQAATGFGTNSDLPIDITADNGESMLGDGVTILRENVHIVQGELEIIAEIGKIYTRDSKVVRIELEGKPVTWHQVIPDEGTLDARADKINYQVDKALIILTGDVFIKHPQGEVNGHEVRYDLEKERFVTRSGGGDDRVHFRINPQTPEKSKNKQPATKTDPGKADEASDAGDG